MEVAVAAVLGVGLFVGFCVVLDRLSRLNDRVGAVGDMLEEQEHARQRRHAETLEALKGRRRA